jgi:hypothetical protein
MIIHKDIQMRAGRQACQLNHTLILQIGIDPNLHKT